MTAKVLSMGVIGTAFKENEYRLPIHPIHFELIDKSLRKRIFVENGYASKFGINNSMLERTFAGVLSREELFYQCDTILLPKPTNADFPFFKKGQILWGWPHCVQSEPITQVGIDKKMTYIAWEAMFYWRSDNVKGMHIFYKNNEMAGYCGVLHALQLAGQCAYYGPHKKAAILSFGSVSRGAILALFGQGYTDITLFTGRPPHAVENMMPYISHHKQYKRKEPDSKQVEVIDQFGNKKDMSKELHDYDIIVNGILQDTNRPIMFIEDKDVKKLKPGTLIIDISCDTAMGFDFAKPASFDNPTFKVGEGIIYYGVDHTPTYLWDSATYEISTALLSFIPSVMAGPETWKTDKVILKSIEIWDGVIQNPKILSFQHRSKEYPHEKKS